MVVMIALGDEGKPPRLPEVVPASVEMEEAAWLATLRSVDMPTLVGVEFVGTAPARRRRDRRSSRIVPPYETWNLVAWRHVKVLTL